MQFTFGPVPSRRLGRSLGVDPLPGKTCNHSCVYCQLGRTRRMVTHRQRFFPVDRIVEEVDRALQQLEPDALDTITIVGTGEPTLYDGLGALIRALKARCDRPVAVLTNGSLLHRAEVRDELAAADLVLPSLDAGDGRTFRAIDRPARGADYEAMFEGLVRFREGFAGRLWLECMLVRGGNDDEASLARLAGRIGALRPDGVQLNRPVRPPAEPWVRGPDPGTLRRMRALLAPTPVLEPVAVAGIGRVLGDDLADAVVSIVARHPMRRDELATVLHRDDDEIGATLAALEQAGRVQRVERLGDRYWCSNDAWFPPQGDREEEP